MQRKGNLTEGNVLGTLLRFAVPVFAAMILQSLYGAVDLFVVGQFAETADVSGVSTGSHLVHTVTMVITGLAMGVTVFVGQRIGRKETKEAGEAVGAGIAMFVVLAMVLAVLMVVLTKPIATAMQAPPEAYEQTCQYIRICGFGMVFVVLYNLVGAILRGLGDSKTPLITVLIAAVINMGADLFFVCVLHMGAAGTAIATVLAQAISVVCSVIILSKKELPFAFSVKLIRMRGRYIAAILRLGVPIALQELLVGFSFILIQAVVNAMSVVASAGVGVAEKVCAFFMLVPSAFSQAISAFVAQNIGAARKDRALKALWCGIAASLCAAVFIGSFSFLRGDLLARIFTKDPAVIVQAHDYLKAYAIDTLLTSIMFCFVGYYNGCGNTSFVMGQGIIGAMAVRVPMVFLMQRIPNASLFHIGLSTPSATFVQIVLCLLFFRYLKKREREQL